METEVESDADEEDLPLGEVVVRLSRVRKAVFMLPGTMRLLSRFSAKQ